MSSHFINLLRGRNKVIKRFPSVQFGRHKFDMPLFITGLPRSGTTFLHNLIDLDPRMQSISYWQAHGLQHEGDEKYKIQFAKNQLDHLYKTHPRLRTIHHNTWHGPEECMHLMKYSLQEPLVGFMSDLPWDDVCELCDLDSDPMYQFFKYTLNLIPPEKDKKHWVFKSPTHMMYLRSLFKYFPTANVVVLIRDKNDVIQSAKSLMRFYRNVGDMPLTIMVKSFLDGMDRCLGLAKPHIPESRITYVDYDDFIINPLGTVGYIYDYFDYAYTNMFEHRMAIYVGQNPKDRWGKHVY